MSRRKTLLQSVAEYAAIRSAFGFAHCFPLDATLDVAASMGRALYRLNRSRRERARTNVRWCFPHLSEDEIERIVIGSYEHMIQLALVDCIATPRVLTPDHWSQRIHLRDMREIINVFLSGKGTILLTGHFGNWELLAPLMAVLGYPVTALARPLDNPLIDAWLQTIRQSKGTRILTKWGGVPELQEVIRGGGRAAFIVDQNAGDRGLFVPFFGRLASSYKSVALLAMRYQAPVVVGGAFRVGGRFQFEMGVQDVIYPEDWTGQPDPVFYITARFTRAIEQIIREVPQQYLWVHRRWKSRPRFEREGKPFPPRLRAKIEALPWMTASELARIIQASSQPFDGDPSRDPSVRSPAPAPSPDRESLLNPD